MRNTDSSGNTSLTISLSSIADVQVVPERLLDHHPPPLVAVLGRQARPGELLAHHRERRRRDRQVERVVAAGAADPVEVLDGLLQTVERLVVAEAARHEAETLREAVPDVLPERGAGVLADGVVDDLAEVLGVPVAPGEPGERETRWQQPAVGQVVDRRHELLARQVAGHAEDHQPAGPRDPRQPLVARVAQRVRPAVELTSPTGSRRGHRVTPSSRRFGRPSRDVTDRPRCTSWSVPGARVARDP